MANTITFEMPESEKKKFENLLDKTLSVLRRLENESPEREARIAESQAEVKKIKKEIRKQLTILAERDKRLDAI